MARRLHLLARTGIASGISPALRGGAMAVGGISPALRGGAMAVLVLAASACRSCDNRPEAPGAGAVETERSEQSARARLLSRMSGRKLDRSKVYPRDASGSVQCDRDADCFILQAERCTPAVLDHLQTVSGYGLNQTVQARYRLTGAEVGRCKLVREVVALDASLDPVMVEALQKRGKTEEEVQTLRTDAIEALRRRNPPRLECFLSSNEVLEASLNLAEGRYNPVHWRTACRELEGPAPRIGSGELAAKASAPSEPTADRSAAPKADVPAPKQP